MQPLQICSYHHPASLARQYNVQRRTMQHVQYSSDIRVFGHVLPMAEDMHAQIVLGLTMLAANQSKARIGRHCTNPLGVLRIDFKEVGLGTARSRKNMW